MENICFDEFYRLLKVIEQVIDSFFNSKNILVSLELDKKITSVF